MSYDPYQGQPPYQGHSPYPQQAPPPGYQGPPPGHQAPPPGHQGPPPGHQGPPPGHQGPPPGHQGPPPGHQGPPPGHQGPPPGHQGPPQGHQPPPQPSWWRSSENADTIVRIVRAVSGTAAAVFLLHILFSVFGANEGNGFVAFVYGLAKVLVLGLGDVFTPGDATIGLIINYSFAAFVYIIVGRLIVRAVRRP